MIKTPDHLHPLEILGDFYCWDNFWYKNAPELISGCVLSSRHCSSVASLTLNQILNAALHGVTSQSQQLSTSGYPWRKSIKGLVISRNDTVKIDAISSDILLFTQRCVQHAFRRVRSYCRTLEE